MTERSNSLKEILIEKDEENDLMDIDYERQLSISQSHIFKSDNIAQFEESKTPMGEIPMSKKIIFDQLVGFGYSYVSLKILFLVQNISSLEEALDLLNKTELGWIHPYIPSEAMQDLCQICGEKATEHADQDQPNRRRSFRLSLHRQRSREENKNVEITIKVKQRKNSIAKMKYAEEEPSLEIISPIDIGDKESCEICYDEIKKDEMHSLKCGHKFCINCTQNYLESTINSGAVLLIRCPQASCREEFSEDNIKKIASPEIFEKYKKFKLNIEVNMNKKARWCPKPNCGKYALVGFGSNKCVCECGYIFCFKCGGEYHGWKSCDKASDQQYQLWAKDKKIQKCPKCKILIHKDAGCNHMTCAFCRYQFCWICGLKYSDDHFRDPICGCPFVQFTNSDWGFTRIFFYCLLLMVIWPLFSLVTSVAMAVEFLDNHLRDYNDCGWIMIALIFVATYCICYLILITLGFVTHCFKILYLLYRVIFLS